MIRKFSSVILCVFMLLCVSSCAIDNDTDIDDEKDKNVRTVKEQVTETVTAITQNIPSDEETICITFDEGLITDEIIDLLVENGIGVKERYIDIINNYPFDYRFVEEIDNTDWKSRGRIYRLDGYLLPGTYEFNVNSTEEVVIEQFLSSFDSIFNEEYKNVAEDYGMTVDEVVILASIIEKEAETAEDVYLISSVFHNRLNNPEYETQGRLESDVTVLYSIYHKTGERHTKAPTGLGNGKEYIGENGETKQNPYADDPYNTYRIKGLPPGAIANPGVNALFAALNPEPTNYYYFFFDGTMYYFSSTQWEHSRIITEYIERNPDALN